MKWLIQAQPVLEALWGSKSSRLLEFFFPFPHTCWVTLPIPMKYNHKTISHSKCSKDVSGVHDSEQQWKDSHSTIFVCYHNPKTGNHISKNENRCKCISIWNWNIGMCSEAMNSFFFLPRHSLTMWSFRLSEEQRLRFQLNP